MLEDKIFEDTKTAFALKSDTELDRAYFLFKMISMQPLVKMGTAMTRFALNAKLPVENLIRATVFDHFCGGTSLDDCKNTIDAMYTKNVHSILDFSIEGEEDESLFDEAFDTVSNVIEFSKSKDAMPFAVFKPTGFGRFEMWRKVSAREELTDEETQEWSRVEDRFDRICAKAAEADICLLIDAEESWMQVACDVLVEEMMAKYNKERAIVFNTIQCYRWDRLDYVKVMHKDAQEKGYIPGVKIVRGAYMEKERKRANKELYDSPICKDKGETDAHFNAVMTYCLDNIDDIWMFIGSHNEESNYLAMELMRQKEIANNDPRVWFGQLYGMSDHITYNMADAGYNMAKYLPFGQVKNVMPYLMRRAEENTSVAGQTNRELNLLQKEKKRRSKKS